MGFMNLIMTGGAGGNAGASTGAGLPGMGGAGGQMPGGP